MEYRLNRHADEIAQRAIRDCQRLGIREVPGQVCKIVDFGIDVPGGLEAGCVLASICVSGYASVELTGPRSAELPWPSVVVRTDHPLAACMASQYAGWQVAKDGYFAMGSGPMRAASGGEELFDQIGLRESSEVAVGVLETRKIPPAAVCVELANKCGVPVEQLLLALAPTASLAGNVQIVARSVETALHKLHELGFDLHRVVSGMGIAPLPAVAGDDLAGIGRTNDAVLYGGSVTLWISGRDDDLETLAPRVPSKASRDFGRPFGEIFQRYEHDFYRIDPHLFSPAEITLVSLESGRTYRGGEVRSDILMESLEG